MANKPVSAIFDSDYKELTPAEVIFVMLEHQIRKGNFGTENGQMRRKPEFTDAEINEYIIRCLERIIGETEVAWKKPRAGTRNELRAEQRKRLAEWLGEKE